VRITENPDGLTSWLAFNPLVQLLTISRNAESLMRIEELALHRAPEDGDGVGADDRRAQTPTSA
jgi:hypothetical protein